MEPKKFTSTDALRHLIEKRLVERYERRTCGRKEYWLIKWSQDSDDTTALVCATQYLDPSEKAPFGAQDQMLRNGKIKEVVLICRKWNHCFRIPSSEFKTFATSMDGERKLFQVDSKDYLSSARTPQPILLTKYLVCY
jgi:hypothetical protein